MHENYSQLWYFWSADSEPQVASTVRRGVSSIFLEEPPCQRTWCELWCKKLARSRQSHQAEIAWNIIICITYSSIRYQNIMSIIPAIRNISGHLTANISKSWTRRFCSKNCSQKRVDTPHTCDFRTSIPRPPSPLERLFPGEVRFFQSCFFASRCFHV